MINWWIDALFHQILLQTNLLISGGISFFDCNEDQFCLISGVGINKTWTLSLPSRVEIKNRSVKIAKNNVSSVDFKADVIVMI